MKPTKRAVLLSLFVPTVIWAAPAQAADLWTGFYAGAQLGYQGVIVDPTLCAVDPLGTDCSFGNGLDDVELGGVEAGILLGYNYQMDNVVLGVEADLNLGLAETSESESNIDFDVLAGGAVSIRARLGMLANERTLIYATGGVSATGEEIEITNCEVFSASAQCGYDSTGHAGWQVGAGVEYFATDRVSVKAEYLYGWYDNEKLTLVRDGEERLESDNELQTNTLRMGVSYHFNGQ
jgi:outer membrane immunogenic protein